MKRMSLPFKDFFLLTFGTLLVAVGVYFFKFPNDFSTGGVSGLSILLGRVLPMVSPSFLVAVINVLFLLVGFFFISSDFGARTVYCTLLFSLSIQGMEWIFPLSAPITDQRLLELIFSVCLPAIGTAILFHQNASTGGTDIAAMLLRKFTSLDIGKSMMCIDFFIAFASLFLVGIETGLFSLFGVFLNSLVIDYVTENLTRRKSLSIITSHPEEACQYITTHLKRGATAWQARGAYTQESVAVVLTALNRMQANDVRKYVKSIDPESFVIVSNTSEIFGKGFEKS